MTKFNWNIDEVELVVKASSEESDGGGGEGGDPPEFPPQPGKGGGKGKPEDKKDDKDKKDGEGEGEGKDKPEDDKKGKGKGSGNGEHEKGEAPSPGDGTGKAQGQAGKEGGNGGGTTDGEDKSDSVFNKIAQNIENANKTNKEVRAPGDLSPEQLEKIRQQSAREAAARRQTVQKVEWKYREPSFNWQEYLANIVSTADGEPTPTYARAARNPTGLAIAAQLGKSAIKPGEITPETKIKFCVVLDSSGSMGGIIGACFAEIQSLLKNSERLADEFIFVRFSNIHEMFKVSIGEGAYVKIGDLNSEIPLQKGKMSDLFKEHYGGGTVFSTALAADLCGLLDANYHMFIVSDEDILDGSEMDMSTGRAGQPGPNLKNLLRVITRSNAGFVWASKESYTRALKTIGWRDNMGYFQ